jgi:hypothetical protein
LLLPAILVVAVAGCGGGAEQTVTVTAGTPASTPTSSSGGATEYPHVGDTITTSLGNTATLIAVEPWKPGKEFSGVLKPDPGNQFWTSEIRLCVTTGNKTVDLNLTGEMTLIMNDDSRPQLEPEWRKPALTTATILPGDCASGWQTFQAPKALDVTGVQIAAGSTALRWQVP